QERVVDADVQRAIVIVRNVGAGFGVIGIQNRRPGLQRRREVICQLGVKIDSRALGQQNAIWRVVGLHAIAVLAVSRAATEAARIERRRLAAAQELDVLEPRRIGRDHAAIGFLGQSAARSDLIDRRAASDRGGGVLEFGIAQPTPGPRVFIDDLWLAVIGTGKDTLRLAPEKIVSVAQ